ncbi:MAG: trigger factor [Deltaproteobacteria bacterium]|nr:trigger factor [Deltaproteobacteria bacterium]MBW2047389.1 trigger factor [Deltaproteobacteria bacterium]MBW2110193.1 trigger factor [Deltaproteobacteria bacterium]
MKTTLEEISPVKKRLHVEIESKEVDKRLNQAYGKIRKRAKIPGFRPGKVPRKILESYFGEQVIDDVTRELMTETFPKAIDEANTFPLGQPVIEKGILKQGQDFSYSAIIEVRPQFQVEDYLGLELEKEILAVTEEDVQKRLEEIREANGKMDSIQEERPVRDGDFVVVDYEGFEGGLPMEGVKSANLLVKMGRNDFHPEFDKALIGLGKGAETEVSIDFGEDFYDKKLAGKTVNFKMRVIDIKELVLPELNDEFARNLGADLKDLDGLKDEVRKALISQEEERIDRELKGRLLEKISRETEVELPETMVEGEIDFSVERFRGNLERGGSSLEKAGISEEDLRKEFRTDAEKRVREMLILDRIAEQDKISIGEDDLEEGFEKLAKRMGQDLETIKKYYEVRGQVDFLRQEMLKEKTLNYLIEHAKISEVEKGALT